MFGSNTSHYIIGNNISQNVVIKLSQKKFSYSGNKISHHGNNISHITVTAFCYILIKKVQYDYISYTKWLHNHKWFNINHKKCINHYNICYI